MGRLALVLCLLVPSLAYGQATPTTALIWTRAPGAEACIDDTVLRAEVDARLARTVFVASDAPLAIEGTIAPADPGFSVQLVLRAGHEVLGERTLTSRRRRCDALDDSLVLMLALLVEVGAQSIAVALPSEPITDAAPVDSTPIDSTSATSEAAPLAIDVAIADPRPPEPNTASSTPGLSMALGLRGGLDALPGAALGLEAALELRWAPFSLRIDGAYLPETGVELTANRAARLSLGWAGLGACVDADALAWLRLGGCIAARGGAVIGVGLGFDRNQSGLLPWASVEAAGRARITLSAPVAIEVMLGLEVPLFRDRFVVRAPDASVRAVYGPPPVSPFAVLSLVLFVEPR